MFVCHIFIQPYMTAR